MRKPGPWRRRILLGLGSVLVAVTVGILMVAHRVPVPLHAGRPVDLWFEELCSGVFGGTGKGSSWSSAYAAFTTMDTNAVPYLCQQLAYDSDGLREIALKKLRQFSLTQSWVSRVVWPSDRRSYAAVALCQMGPKASAAVPALLERLGHERDTEVKLGLVAALESILHGKVTDGLQPAEFHTLEARLIAEALGRHPELVAHLKLETNAFLKATQFYQASTNPPSAGTFPNSR